jgi:hypothetical protein
MKITIQTSLFDDLNGDGKESKYYEYYDRGKTEYVLVSECGKVLATEGRALHLVALLSYKWVKAFKCVEGNPRREISLIRMVWDAEYRQQREYAWEGCASGSDDGYTPGVWPDELETRARSLAHGRNFERDDSDTPWTRGCHKIHWEKRVLIKPDDLLVFTGKGSG